MFKSIRGRLLIWHAVILLLAVAGFGAALYAQVRRARLDEIDADLHAAARSLEGTLRTFPPHVLEGRPEPPGRRPGGPPHLRPGPRRPPHGPGPPPPPDGERPDSPEPGRPHGPGPRPPFEQGLMLPEHFRNRPEAPYFVVWRANGEVLKASSSAPPSPPPPAAAAEASYRVRQRGPLREVILTGPLRTRVLVGRSVIHEDAELTRLAWQVFSTGLAVLAVGMAGGWVLSRRAVRPIAAMSATAAALSADNLSRRIDLRDVDSELGELGRILNDLFARLESAFERQVRFTADASHELRTPLAVIHSQAELALARPRSSEDYRDALEACLRASRRMRGLVEALLTLARADAGQLEMHRERVDLAALVEDSIALLAPLATAEKVNLEVEAEGENVAVTGDPGRLSQVVTNLLTNAIHYNRAGGQVKAAVAAMASEAVLTVADTGCGIPIEEQPRVFERFFRVDRARSRARGGSGLGLAICKSIVEAHGGTIGFTSVVNQGTTFVVRLPLAAANC
jgi:two-component system OmpR family sensor kinase